MIPLVRLLTIFGVVSFSEGFSTSSSDHLLWDRVAKSNVPLEGGRNNNHFGGRISTRDNGVKATSCLSTELSLAYVSPENEREPSTFTKKGLVPKIGDLVRYYDLDGGRKDGQELVGKITFLTKTSAGWLAELTELEDVGDGYYAEYSSSKRMSKKTDRDVKFVSPIAGSFVRSEQAYKVPKTAEGRPSVRQESYDLEDWEGPQAIPINEDVLQQDGVLYGELKASLIKNAALTGVAGSILVSIIKGTEDAAIYFFGALASVGYLFFLSVKTDTLASPDRKLGNNVANLRFLMPVLVIVGVALYNQSRGELNPLKDTGNMFDTVTTEQFGAAVLGFLTYRVPLFVGQLREAFKDEEVILPGSAGVAMKLVKEQAGRDSSADRVSMSAGSQTTVLLVSGPQATGRPELVKQLLEQDDRFVAPKLVDQVEDSVTFDRLMSRGDFLRVDPSGRFGLTKDAIMSAVDDDESGKIVVVDADVSLAKKMQKLSGARLIGVWVGLNSVKEFEDRLAADIESGKILVPPDETKESILRAKIKEIVNEIEFGLSSGIFEFTILNKDPEESVKELKEAAAYAFL